MKVGKIVLAALAGATGALAALYRTRLQTAASIREVARSEDGYGIYAMDVTYDYDIDRIERSGYEDSAGYVQAVLAESLPFVPVHIDVPSFGCSALQVQTVDGMWLTGRNYDFKRDTSMMLVHCTPKDGYESIAFAALDNIGVVDSTTSLVKRLACLTTPFICLDGINSQGVTVSVLTLDSKPTAQHTGKPKLSTSLVMRLVLDRAATTDEAVDLLSRYDMIALMGRDYHFFISDVTGKAVVVEYDCKTPERTMTVTPSNVVTNFYIMYGQDVSLTDNASEFGHGYDRYETILDILCREDGEYRLETVWDCLREASQLPNPDDITSNTQWSVVYDHVNGTADVVQRRQWEETHHFAIGSQ